MKRIIIAGASVIVAVAIGAAIASAFSKKSGAYGLNAAPSTATSRSGRSLYELQVGALTSQGISEARAVEALNFQSEAWHADLARKIEAALGRSYAGLWFDNASAQLHVGVTSAAARKTVERVAARVGLRSRVTEVPVRSTWGQLEAALKPWQSRLASLVQGGQAMVGLAAQSNAVAVTLSPSVPTSQRAAIEGEATHADVNVSVGVAPHQLVFEQESASNECKVFVRAEAYCNKTLTSGVTIAIGPETKDWECTAGPMVIPRATKSETYMLTAGHCIGEYGTTTISESKWFTFNNSKEGQEIGPALEFFYGTKGDTGLIAISKAGYWVEGTKDPVIANTAEWGTKNPETKYVVAGEGVFVEHTIVCHEGQTTGQSCGEQNKINPTTIYGPGTKVIEGLVEVVSTGTLKCEGGDSGGPWLQILTKSNNEAIMFGAHSGGATVGTGPCFYESLSKIYSLLPRNLELLTKGNEVR